jgi:heptosyltransferase-3
VVDHHLDALRLLGLQPGKPPLGFYWSPEDENRLKGLLAARGFTSDRPFVVVHPTSRWMFKTWRLDGYAEVIAHLQRDLGLAVIVTGSPDRKERGAAGDIIRMSNSKPLDLSGQLTLKQLGCLISRARFFFGVDSAPMHIAAAVGTPVIALFGPSGDHMWGPWGEGHRVVKKDWECRPCGQDGCRGTKVSRCLVEITTDEVIAEIESLVKTLPDPAPGGQAALR